MKYLFLSLLFIAPCAFADSVTVINSTNNPVNITGSLSIALPAITTVTFNGAAQPVTQSGVWTVSPGTGIYPVGGNVNIAGSISNTSFIATQAIDGGLNASVSIKGTSNTVSGTGNFTIVQPVDSNLNGSFSLKGTSNTVTGTGNFTIVQPVDSNLNGSFSIKGTSNTVQITGTPTIANTSFGATQAVDSALNGSFSLKGTSNTVTGTGNFTVVQAVDSNLNGSFSIKGTSNTVQITGTPAHNLTQVSGNAVTTSGIAGEQRVSVEIQGTSNTVVANAGSGTFNIQSNASVNLAEVNAAGVTVAGTAGEPRVSVEIQGTSNTVNGPTLTKATQGAVGFSTQDLKDAGRTYITLLATGTAGVTTEALFTFAQTKQGAASAGVTSYVPTNGKTLRIQGLYCANRSATTTISWGRAVIRHQLSGAAVVASQPIFAVEYGGAAALAGSTGTSNSDFPDGLEIRGDGTQAIGVSHLDQATGNVVTCTLVGYEY